MKMINAMMFLDRKQFAREAPVLVRDENPETVKRQLIGRLPKQDGNVVFCQLALDSYSVRVGLGKEAKYLGNVYLVPDKIAEAIEVLEYLKLFDEDGENVLSGTWARVEVKERLERICYIHVRMDDDFPDYIQGRPDEENEERETKYGWEEHESEEDVS